MRRYLTVLVLPVLLLAGCAQPPGDSVPDAGPADNYGADDVVVRVEHSGGFVPVEYLITALPLVTVYGDGRVITEGPVIAVYPGPALPNVLVRQIDRQSVDELVRLAVAAGVGRGEDLGTPLVADAPATVLTVLTDRGLRRTSVYALGIEAASDPSLSKRQRDGRRKLQEFVGKLTDLPTTLGASRVGPEQPYEPTALAALVRPWVDPGQPTQEPKAWPGPALPGDRVRKLPDDFTCVDVTGTDLEAVLDAAQWPTNRLTPWEWDGERYTVWLRPLLPDESSCADLA